MPGPYSYTVQRGRRRGQRSRIRATRDSPRCPTRQKPSAPANLNATAERLERRRYWAGTPRATTSRSPATTSTATGTVIDTAGDRSTRTQLAPAGQHGYQVRAVDAAGNLSDPSNTARYGDVADTEKPTAPGNLNATAPTLEPGRPGLAGGDRQRRRHRLPDLPDGALLDSIGATTSYSDTNGLARRLPTATRCARSTRPATSRTRATRATVTVADTEKPTAPSNLNATTRDRQQVDLTLAGGDATTSA